MKNVKVILGCLLVTLFSEISGPIPAEANFCPPEAYSFYFVHKPFSHSVGQRTIEVTPTSPACSWTAESAVPWISIVSGQSGVGKGTVAYSVEPNPAVISRTSEILIGGRSVSVYQGFEKGFVPGTATGAATLRPNRFRAGAEGSMALQFKVGAGGIPVGGGVRILFPKGWPFLRGLISPFQPQNPSKPNYISVQCSRKASTPAVLIDYFDFNGKAGVRGGIRMVTLKVRNAPLLAGDTIMLSVRNTQNPPRAGTEEVLVAVDQVGDGSFKMLERGAPYTILPGPVHELTLIGPSQAVVGQPVQFQITALDEFENPTPAAATEFVVSGLGNKSIHIEPKPGSRLPFAFSWTPEQPGAASGFYWPSARVTLPLKGPGGRQTTSIAQVRGNPIRVFRDEPPVKIYWGDIHSHSGISKDAQGKGDFRYARDVSRLDFFSSSEHAEDDADGPGITPEEWEQIRRQVQGYYVPGRFVTLMGYECMLLTPSSHHNVYSASLDVEPVPRYEVGTLGDLWSRLNPGQSVSVPHATGEGVKQLWARAMEHWLDNNVVMRPLMEIYSSHGSSEFYVPGGGLEGPYYARDAWRSGQRIGVIASSDKHTAQPGTHHRGLAAVRAPALTREAVFSALSNRSTYATTGARIYMDFKVAGLAMGQSGQASGPVAGALTLAAPSDISYVEIVRLDLASGTYQTLKRWDKPGRMVDASFGDTVAGSGFMYYVRAELAARIHGLPVRAWSSPVWVDRN